VEGAGPRQPHLLADFTDDALRAPGHLERRAAREGEKQDPFRRHALQDQVRDPIREGVRLAGACTRDDEKRGRSRLRRLALPRVELLEGRCGRHGGGL
jgi:hypothetical protein